MTEVDGTVEIVGCEDCASAAELGFDEILGPAESLGDRLEEGGVVFPRMPPLHTQHTSFAVFPSFLYLSISPYKSHRSLVSP